MIIGADKLRSLISVGALVKGCDLSQINPASVNLRLGHSFLIPKRMGQNLPLGGEQPYGERYVAPGEKFLLFPGEFVLATTLEQVTVPTEYSAFVQGRSSMGRIGLTTQNAGFIDPGFDGHITLELVNEGPSVLELVPGYPVVQVIFFETSGASAYDGKYQGQVEATGSRMYLDREAGHDA